VVKKKNVVMSDPAREDHTFSCSTPC